MDQTALTAHRQRDKADLQTLLTALNGAKRALHRDECGDAAIQGSRGTIRCCNGTYSIFLECHSARAWGFAKKQLAGIAVVTQDGDEEGVLTFTRTPTAEEAETLRHYLGIRQTVPPETALRLRSTPLKEGVHGD
jgi:hypothetical protein